ncbi:MAG: perosamine synthetase [Parvicella sp.]|jgi:perosamine synthetase
MSKFDKIIDFIKNIYPNQDFIPLHAPVFNGNEKKYVLDTIDSTFVSSVGAYVNQLEGMMKEYTGAKHAIAVVNGTSALHMSLLLSGVERGDLVITQALSFVATCNAISYLGASPAFVDVDKKTMGMSVASLKDFLKDVKLVEGKATHLPSGKIIRACVPMHTFGFPCEVDEIVNLCNEYNIVVVEDSAESIGSFYKGKHTGRYGKFGVFSFNGNKTITSGSGGVIITDNEELGKKAKHLTTQAKVPHKWEFFHDNVGYNYRCANINAALACAQLEQLEDFIDNKRKLSLNYKDFFFKEGIEFVDEPANSRSNFWLNVVLFENINERDAFLTETNNNGVMTRPVWTLLNKLPMFEDSYCTDLSTSNWFEARAVNIPSSVK